MSYSHSPLTAHALSRQISEQIFKVVGPTHGTITDRDALIRPAGSTETLQGFCGSRIECLRRNMNIIPSEVQRRISRVRTRRRNVYWWKLTRRNKLLRECQWLLLQYIIYLR